MDGLQIAELGLAFGVSLLCGVFGATLAVLALNVLLRDGESTFQRHVAAIGGGLLFFFVAAYAQAMRN